MRFATRIALNWRKRRCWPPDTSEYREMTQSTDVTSDMVRDRRAIIHRTRGHGHGPIVRLMSPSDLGHSLKPFVFLDLFEMDASMIGAMDVHPHSGIATVTLITQGDVRFDDPDAGTGTIGYGGVEWMRAGGGAWHGKEMSRGGSARIQGFQLWIALGADCENLPGESQYLEARHMPVWGPATVIIGGLDGAHSPVRAPDGITYLLVTLKPGERWRWQPPPGQSVAWLAVARGVLDAGERITAGEMVSFEQGESPIILEASGDSDAVFVIASALPHPHDLVLGYYSVHTSADALQAGEARIAELGALLRTSGGRARPGGAVPVYR